jgi:hypothetical protein
MPHWSPHFQWETQSNVRVTHRRRLGFVAITAVLLPPDRKFIDRNVTITIHIDLVHQSRHIPLRLFPRESWLSLRSSTRGKVHFLASLNQKLSKFSAESHHLLHAEVLAERPQLLSVQGAAVVRIQLPEDIRRLAPTI